MGYSYGRTSSGRMALCCDYCGEPGGARKRTCPYKVTSDNSRSSDGRRHALPYCYPPAACGPCWKQHGASVHAGCKDGAAKMQAEDDAKQARLDAGDPIALAAWGDWEDGVPPGMVRVVFGGPSGHDERNYLMPRDVYGKRRGGFLSDYPQAVPIADPAAGRDGFGVMQVSDGSWSVARYAAGRMVDNFRRPGDQVALLLAQLRDAVAGCEHETGQPGCALLTCWGVPAERVLDRGRLVISQRPRAGETGVEMFGRRLAIEVRALRRDLDVTMPTYADSGWYEREVRKVQAWELTAGGVPVRLVSYESRSALVPTMLSYGALYVGGVMSAGAVDMYRVDTARQIAYLVDRNLDRELQERAAARPPVELMARRYDEPPPAGDADPWSALLSAL